MAERDKPKVEVDQNDPESTELSIGIPGPGLKYQLNGGMEVEYGVRMRPGDVITGVTRLVGYSEREGRLGLILHYIPTHTRCLAAHVQLCTGS